MTASLRTRAQVRQWLACLDAAAALTTPLVSALVENVAAAAALSAATADTLAIADKLYAGLRARVAMRAPGAADAPLNAAAAHKVLDDLRSGVGADGVEAPPNATAVDSARAVVLWALHHGLAILDVSADRLGGVAVTLGQGPRSVWVACMNSGAATFVGGSCELGAIHGAWDDAGREKVLAFLKGGEA